MRAHLVWQPEPAHLEILRADLEPAVEWTCGEDLPEPPDFEILVGGRPTGEQLDASPSIRALLIPYAGMPPETAKLLAERPSVAVHNLHHNAAPTTEMALALLLAAAKRIVPMDRDLRADRWSGRGRSSPAVLLEGRTALLVGFGAIGRRLAPALRALGVTVVAVRRNGAEEEIDGVRVHPPSRLGDLLPTAELVVVCAPMTAETKGLLGPDEIARLPAGCVLVNVARGPIVDEEALFEALRDGRIGAAGLDVWYRYPGRDGDPENTEPANLPFRDLDNVVLSPHRSGSVLETEDLRMRHLAESLNAAARGEPLPNRVDLDAGY